MDSFPRLSRIDAPVAEDVWLCEFADGETRRNSRIVIGRPKLLPEDPHQDWYCEVEFEHHTLGPKCFLGVGPLDAFLGAMRFVMDCASEAEWVTPRQEVKTGNGTPIQASVDWEPHLERIDDLIVEDWRSYALPDGSKRVSKIMVGRPAQLPDGSDWYSPFFFEHLTPGIQCAYGVGPVDALRNAAHYIISRLAWFSFVSPRPAPPGGRPLAPTPEARVTGP